MQPQDNKKGWLVATVIAVFAFWPIIGPKIEERWPGSLDWLPSINIGSTNPFDTTELRVLMVYETEKPLTLEQKVIANGVGIRQLVEGAGGRFAARDNMTTTTGEGEKAFGDLMLKEKDRPLPWFAVGKGGRGYIGSVPTTEAEAKHIINGVL